MQYLNKIPEMKCSDIPEDFHIGKLIFIGTIKPCQGGGFATLLLKKVIKLVEMYKDTKMLLISPPDS